MRLLSFREFQQSGVIVTPEQAARQLTVEVDELGPCSGGISYDGLIVLRSEYKGVNQWHLHVERSEYYEDDLATIERLAYDYSIEAGAFAAPPLDCFQI